MKFFIADTFHKALGRLNAQEQKAVKITVFDLQSNPASPGLQFHRIDRSRDDHFWSVRVNRDIRLIMHRTADSLLVCYVGHHDEAYAWAGRRRIETHPRTGAAQIVEVRELVEEIPLPSVAASADSLPVDAAAAAPAQPELPFAGLQPDELLMLGVPQDWLDDILHATEDSFLEIAGHLPAEAAEALLDFIATGMLPESQVPAAGTSPFEHPDAQRRFRVMDNVEELQAALEYPMEQWAVFLHPAQRRLVARRFGGPARIAGSAGTGKTVVALHRAAHLLRQNPDARVLLTTFSLPLANALRQKMHVLLGERAADITILPFREVGRQLFTLAFGHEPHPAGRELIRKTLLQAREELGLTEFSERFVISEWHAVVDPWQLDGPDAYATVPRVGRRMRLGARQRERIWPLFERARELLRQDGRDSWAGILAAVAAHYKERDEKPFDHVIVDECQDLSVPELQMMAAIAPQYPDALFFAGDLAQRIFRQPFSWKRLGVDIRGRSHILRINYRTSHQIRRAADRLLPDTVRDVDGNEEDRRGTISVFNGPEPEVRVFDSADEEGSNVAKWLAQRMDEGIRPEEMGVFVRTSAAVQRARLAAQKAGLDCMELSDRLEDRDGRLAVGTMHLAKGLEFRAVVVMACDEELLPLQERLETAADEAELDAAYETERHLFYVACTRARERLLITGLKPGSEFLEDFMNDDGS